jgi:hypothetical protein
MLVVQDALLHTHKFIAPEMQLKCAALQNSMALVRERTILTERPPLVGVVIAKFC